MQKYLFILLFLIFSCDEPVIEGCTTSTACNYNVDATKDDGSCLENDCVGECGGSAVIDECEVCGGGGIVDGTCDCDGNGIADGACDCDGNIEDCTGECGGDAVEDIDGNCYSTVQIGDQLWMAENLKVTHYNNGDEISYPNNEDWGSYNEGQYGVYDDDPANADIHGNLYNFAVVADDRGVCPEGFHVPSDEEFMELEMELGMSEEYANSMGYRGTDEGSKLAGNSDLWNEGDLVNNSEFGTSGFNVLPAGSRHYNSGDYTYMGYYSLFWSSSEKLGDLAWYRILCDYKYSYVSRYYTNKENGFSIRCLQG